MEEWDTDADSPYQGRMVHPWELDEERERERERATLASGTGKRRRRNRSTSRRQISRDDVVTRYDTAEEYVRANDTAPAPEPAIGSGEAQDTPARGPSYQDIGPVVLMEVPPPTLTQVEPVDAAMAITEEPTAVRVTATQFLDLDPVPYDPALDPPPRACFNCWLVEHARRRCPFPASMVYCYNCGRRRRTLRDCPRCYRRHNNFLRQRQGETGGPAEEKTEHQAPIPPTSSELNWSGMASLLEGGSPLLGDRDPFLGMPENPPMAEKEPERPGSPERTNGESAEGPVVKISAVQELLQAPLNLLHELREAVLQLAVSVPAPGSQLPRAEEILQLIRGMAGVSPALRECLLWEAVGKPR